VFEIYDVAIIPLILGVVELFKRIGLPAKYSPLVAVALGLIVGVVYLDASLKERVLVGIMFGLSASGLYSGTKNIVEKGDENNG
jgi:L-cystine uptake protein TcyP (sodium:dicarboxylate symporter family)